MSLIFYGNTVVNATNPEYDPAISELIVVTELAANPLI
jgi:hypothetical protein